MGGCRWAFERLRTGGMYITGRGQDRWVGRLWIGRQVEMAGVCPKGSKQGSQGEMRIQEQAKG